MDCCHGKAKAKSIYFQHGSELGKEQKIPNIPHEQDFLCLVLNPPVRKQPRKGFLLDWRETDEESLFSRNKHGGSGQKNNFSLHFRTKV